MSIMFTNMLIRFVKYNTDAKETIFLVMTCHIMDHQVFLNPTYLTFLDFSNLSVPLNGTLCQHLIKLRHAITRRGERSLHQMSVVGKAASV